MKTIAAHMDVCVARLRTHARPVQKLKLNLQVIDMRGALGM